MDFSKAYPGALGEQLEQLQLSEIQINRVFESIRTSEMAESRDEHRKQLLCQLQHLMADMTQRIAELKSLFEATQLLAQKQQQPSSNFRTTINNQGLHELKKVQGESAQPKRKRFYGFFSEKIKRDVVQAVSSGKTVREVGSIFGICYKNIERWISHGIKRKHSLRPKRNHQLELVLSQWIKQESRMRQITYHDVCRRALHLNRDYCFKASMGWARQYVKRWNLEDVIVRSILE